MPDGTTYAPASPQVELAPEQRVLLRAAEKVDSGWCQHRPGDGLTMTCAGYALHNAAVEIGGEKWEALWERAEAMMAPLIVPFRYVPEWNDAPGRTAAEVASALRQAALGVRT